MVGQWHYQHDDQKFGPVLAADLKKLVEGGELLPTDLVWKEGMEKWVPARSVKGLFSAGTGATANPTTTTPTPAKAVRSGPPPLPPPLPDGDEDDDEYRSQAKARPSRRTLLIAGGSVVGLLVVTLAGLMLFGGKSGKKLSGGFSPVNDGKELSVTAEEFARDMKSDYGSGRWDGRNKYAGAKITIRGKFVEYVGDWNRVLLDGGTGNNEVFCHVRQLFDTTRQRGSGWHGSQQPVRGVATAPHRSRRLRRAPGHAPRARRRPEGDR